MPESDKRGVRFDLHTLSLSSGRVLVTLEATDGSGVQASTWVELQAAIGTAGEYLNDTHRIGYGNTGFETFTLDIPDNLKGKVATLSFTLNSGEVYLDNVFFKSQHLLFGNPTLNGQEARSNVSTNANNFLIEKPQYAVSYNSGNKGPNWVSWQLNKSWLGDYKRPGANDVTTDYPYGKLDYPWMPDVTLPSGIATSIPTNYSADPNYDRGHLTPNEQRNRSRKDQIATFLTTNLLPQEELMNQRQAWRRFEEFTRDIVKYRGWELYTIAGGAGSLEDSQVSVPPLKSLYGIETPEWFWKVIVALRPGQELEDITVNTPVIAVQFPNFSVSPLNDPDAPDPRLWSTWTVRIKDTENLTGQGTTSA